MQEGPCPAAHHLPLRSRPLVSRTLLLWTMVVGIHPPGQADLLRAHPDVLVLLRHLERLMLPVRRRLHNCKYHGSLSINFVDFSMSCASQAWPLGCMRPGGRSLASSLMHEWPGGTCGTPW